MAGQGGMGQILSFSEHDHVELRIEKCEKNKLYLYFLFWGNLR